MNVVCYERVCYEWVCYERGLFWVVCYEWSVLNGSVLNGHRDSDSGFFQVVAKSTFPRGANSGEISFSQVDTKRKAFIY